MYVNLIKSGTVHIENEVWFVYYTGLVPLNDSSSPKYAFDVYLGSNSVINYGTYVNRQRYVCACIVNV